MLRAESSRSANLKVLQASPRKTETKGGELGTQLSRPSHTPIPLVPGCAADCYRYIFHPCPLSSFPWRTLFRSCIESFGLSLYTRFPRRTELGSEQGGQHSQGARSGRHLLLILVAMQRSPRCDIALAVPRNVPSSISSCGLNLSTTPQAIPMPRPIKRARTDEKGLANRVQAAREENSLFGEEDQQPGISLMDPVEVGVPRMYSPQARIATAQLQYMIPRSGNRSIQGKVKAQLKITRSLDCSR